MYFKDCLFNNLSLLDYVPTAWGNTNYPQNRISLLQKKALRIIDFAQFNSHTSPLVYNSNILKFIDIIYNESVINDFD